VTTNVEGAAIPSSNANVKRRWS